MAHFAVSPSLFPALPVSAPSPTGEPDPFRLGLLYTFVFVEIGIAMPFMPVWLGALGLDAGLIGLLLALPIATKVIATRPLMGLIDRGVRPRTLLVAGSLALAASYALMPLAAAWAVAPLAGLIVLNAVAQAPLVPSIDYLTLAAARRSPRIGYARIRMCGSVGFLAANLAGGALLGMLGDRVTVPLLLTGLALGATFIAAVGHDSATGTAPRPASVAPPPLPPVLRLSIGAAALIQASHAAVYAFGSLDWSRHGVPTPWIGALWATGVAAEIALFAFIGRWPARWRSPFRLLGLGAGAALVRALGLGLAQGDLALLLPLQVLHGLTFGATHLGVMAAVSGFAPEGARGRAQGTVGASTAFVSALATLACGAIYRALGGSATFVAMAPLALAGLALVVLARRSRGRPETGRFGGGSGDAI